MISKSYVVCLAVCSLDMYGVCLLYTANIYNIFVTMFSKRSVFI
ncbi:hypothetical protein HMPREF2533_03111 [Bacteroides fragilis]|nr:hypothetical protein HMPREF2530_03111 [Bacteroides fragilis]KXU43632.1 hypothetical protein HMPREF2533_03111 [Bacteroides fragilis]